MVTKEDVVSVAPILVVATSVTELDIEGEDVSEGDASAVIVFVTEDDDECDAYVLVIIYEALTVELSSVDALPLMTPPLH